VEDLAGDDHGGDEHRHGRVDEGFMATEHRDANLAPAGAAGIPQRE